MQETRFTILCPGFATLFLFCKRCQNAALNQAIFGPTAASFSSISDSTYFILREIASAIVGLAFFSNVPFCWWSAAAASP
jgi:hypothetical protein